MKLQTYFAAAGDSCNPNSGSNPFFGFPHWWKYIKEGERDAFGKCIPTVHFPGEIWTIAFAIVDILLFFAGMAAVISIIIAGISYITSAGNSEKISSSRRRIVNSLIGLAIVLIAIAVVSFIGNSVG